MITAIELERRVADARVFGINDTGHGGKLLTIGLRIESGGETSLDEVTWR